MIEKYLKTDDDPNLWREVMDCLAQDIEVMLSERSYKGNIYLLIGVCNHWTRPHQTRWTANGGFAWPSGYGGNGSWSRGLPEFDWSCGYRWSVTHSHWEPIQRQEGKRKLTVRVAIPARTKVHDQAAVHTMWEQGTPNEPGKKMIRFYGYRKKDQKWSYKAHKDFKV